MSVRLDRSVSKKVSTSLLTYSLLLTYYYFVDSDFASELVPAVVASGSNASCTMPQLNAGEYTLKLSMNGYSLSGTLKV